ncbi:MAG: MFS transporter [Pseudomonadota bacterium]
MPSPFLIPAVRYFIAFRVFFNARFYYPVFTILFLDFGLTLSQFALLNAAWAATIVICEVPSGALADMIGRQRLLVFAGVAMVVEIGLLCIVPLGGGPLLFTVFLINRVLSGMAEAAASGADEALAYDALKHAGQEGDWGRVLETLMRVQSMAFIAAMTIGAAVYDPALVQSVLAFFGCSGSVLQADTLRLPLYLTLAMAVAATGVSLKMKDAPSAACPPDAGGAAHCSQSMTVAFRRTLSAGRWILKTPFALVLIAAGMLFDHVIRMVLTMNSQYYRLIHLPEATFGLIGSLMAVAGLFIPRLARHLVERRTPEGNLWLLGAATAVGLGAMALFIPYAGLIPAVLLVSVMYTTNFMMSSYLNQITDSSQRATVLSFKGLCFNLAYGSIGVLYALLLAVLARPGGAGGSSNALADARFVSAMPWFMPYFMVLFVLLVVIIHHRKRAGAVP